MSPSDLNRAVSRATGETIDEIAFRGFGMLLPLPAEPAAEALIAGWRRSRPRRGRRRKSRRRFAPRLRTAA